MSLKGRHFLCLSDYTGPELRLILETAKEIKAKTKARIPHRVLEGRCMAMIFQQPSNRTRVSFEVGMYQLGGKTLNVHPSEISMGKREPIADVSKVMSRYVDAVMMRVQRHWELDEFAEHATVPVINGLSDRVHPCQAISDMLTIEEHKGKLEGLRLCYVGDGNNVCASLIHACHLLGLQMVVSCPKAYDPDVPQAPWGYEMQPDPQLAVKDADIIYTDVWTSMGQEEETARRLRKFKSYAISGELMSHAKKDAIFMHCLPAHRGEEVLEEVVDGPQSVVFDQAENRMHVQKAILALILGDE